jgi:hypothetical protein
MSREAKVTYDMRPVGIAHGAIFDRFPLEAVEEEDDGHDQGRHHAPCQGPVGVGPANVAAFRTDLHP